MMIYQKKKKKNYSRGALPIALMPSIIFSNCLNAHLHCVWVVFGLKNMLSITFPRIYIFLFLIKKGKLNTKNPMLF